MKAVTYQGIKQVKVQEVDDPKLHKPDDIIVRVTSTGICGSDLHLIHGMIPNMPKNYIIGHEPIGIVEEVGPGVKNLKKGDTVIILGCGPVGLAAQKFAWMKGAERVIAVDYIDYRLDHAKAHNNVEIVNFEQHENTGEYLREMTKGGADVVIDCVGMDGKMTYGK